MEKQLNNKVVLVTGAGRGIGAATAKLFAQAGATVALVSRTNSQLKEVAYDIEQAGGKAVAFPTDLKSCESIRNTFSEVKEMLGEIDTLINNAGFLSAQPVLELSLENWNETIAVNLTAAFVCSQEAFRQMSKKGGSIVNVSSLAGIRGVEKFPGFSAYTASKHGVVGLTEAFALEGKPMGIRVNAIAPGAVNTKMLRDVAPDYHSNTKPDDIAKIIFHLATCETLNGSILEVFCNG